MTIYFSINMWIDPDNYTGRNYIFQVAFSQTFTSGAYSYPSQMIRTQLKWMVI